MSEQSDAEHAAEVRARLAAATPGPWRVGAEGSEGSRVNPDSGDKRERSRYIVACNGRSQPEDGRNADLIANAPADLERLLAIVERERERADRAQDARYEVEQWLSTERNASRDLVARLDRAERDRDEALAKVRAVEALAQNLRKAEAEVREVKGGNIGQEWRRDEAARLFVEAAQHIERALAKAVIHNHN